jgi:hypothetical protein
MTLELQEAPMCLGRRTTSSFSLFPKSCKVGVPPSGVPKYFLMKNPSCIAIHLDSHTVGIYCREMHAVVQGFGLAGYSVGRVFFVAHFFF